MMFKKTLEPFRHLEKSFKNFWSGTPEISYTGEGAFLPEIDVFENDKEFHVTANVPGLEEGDIHVNLNEGKITLRGGKKIEKEENGSNYRIIEHSSVYFNHTVQLPNEIEEDDFKTTMKDGVLDITLPKLAGAKLKKTTQQKQIH